MIFGLYNEKRIIQRERELNKKGLTNTQWIILCVVIFLLVVFIIAVNYSSSVKEIFRGEGKLGTLFGYDSIITTDSSGGYDKVECIARGYQWCDGKPGKCCFRENVCFIKPDGAAECVVCDGTVCRGKDNSICCKQGESCFVDMNTGNPECKKKPIPPPNVFCPDPKFPQKCGNAGCCKSDDICCGAGPGGKDFCCPKDNSCTLIPTIGCLPGSGGTTTPCGNNTSCDNGNFCCGQKCCGPGNICFNGICSVNIPGTKICGDSDKENWLCTLTQDCCWGYDNGEKKHTCCPEGTLCVDAGTEDFGCDYIV